MDWRTLMQWPQTENTSPQYPQNPQNPTLKPSFEDIENNENRLLGENSDSQKGDSFPPTIPRLGQWIEFNSPLFGNCTGQVVLADGDMVVIQYHSILHDERFIKASWITRNLDSRP